VKTILGSMARGVGFLSCLPSRVRPWGELELVSLFFDVCPSLRCLDTALSAFGVG